MGRGRVELTVVPSLSPSLLPPHPTSEVPKGGVPSVPLSCVSRLTGSLDLSLNPYEGLPTSLRSFEESNRQSQSLCPAHRSLIL